MQYLPIYSFDSLDDRIGRNFVIRHGAIFRHCNNGSMPVKSPPKERSLIEMFLSAYEYGMWKDASLDWVEEKQDAAVEVVATKVDGTTLALEHTLIQPFVDEKFDSERFVRAFGCIHKNPALVIPERELDVIIPVGAIPNGYLWKEVGNNLLSWLIANHTVAPEGYSVHAVRVGSSKRLTLKIRLQCTRLPGLTGRCLVSRDRMPKDLRVNVEKALRRKLPKLVKTEAARRVLLFERDQIIIGDSRIYEEIAGLAPLFPELSSIDEIWFANTAMRESEGSTYFTLIDGCGLVELLRFQNGVMRYRRDDRAERVLPNVL